MKFGLASALVAALSLLVLGTAKAEVRTCLDSEVKAANSDVGFDQRDDHALFSVAQITYNRPKVSVLGLDLRFVIAEDGSIVCMQDRQDVIRKMLAETPERQALVGQMEGWRFKPFLVGNKPVRALTQIYVPEKIDFHFHEDMPAATTEAATITLRRSTCFGSCPDYSVTLHGSGWVEFTGKSYTAMTGRHLYTVDPKAVTALFDRLRQKDVWSTAGNWVGSGADAPFYSMDITIGGETRHFKDFFGKQLGMPQAFTDAMADVDDTSRADDMIHLSSRSVAQLEAEGFDFHSRKAADMFLAAVNDGETHDDAGLLRMIDLGVPITNGRRNPDEYLRRYDTVINASLRNHRTTLIDPLLAKGVLNTRGHPDQAKIDSAFQAAIEGGRLALVKRLWEQAATRPHPSLTFADTDEDGKVTRRSPVTLLLHGQAGDTGWEGLATAQWLVAQGCDLKAQGADGNNLLEIAVEADDFAMVKYLLAQGMDAAAPGKYGSSALGSVESDEDMAMLLIDAGADPWKLETDVYSFTDFARNNGWTRVLAWMEAHKPAGGK